MHPVNDPMYRDIEPERLPSVESLADTRTRVMSFWHDQVEPAIRQGKQGLISAHGNTLRSLLMVLDQISDDQVDSFEIPTAAR
jgi:2,3-bisphosphoglycerate-dependent phosphoglycerate mutase